MRNPELIPIFGKRLPPTSAPEVAYRAIVALEQSIGSVAESAAIVPGLQLALRNNSAQVRMHAAKLLGSIQAEVAIPDLVPASRGSEQLRQGYRHSCAESYRETRCCPAP